MGALVLLTVYLRQKGSPSKQLDQAEDQDLQTQAGGANAPWPVQKGGILARMYAHSLSTALFLLFAVSFTLHALGSSWHASEDAVRHGQAPVGFMDNISGAEFWFESLQNWRSEFLSVAVLALLGNIQGARFPGVQAGRGPALRDRTLSLVACQVGW